MCDCFVGVTHRHLSDHMSELVENTLSDLDQSKVRFSITPVQRFNGLVLLYHVKKIEK